jgi:hypothetical protein
LWNDKREGVITRVYHWILAYAFHLVIFGLAALFMLAIAFGATDYIRDGAYPRKVIPLFLKNEAPWLALLFVEYLIDFIVDFIRKREYEGVGILKYIVVSFKRIFIVLGAVLAFVFLFKKDMGFPLVILIGIVTVKTAIELWRKSRKNKKSGDGV